MIKVTITGYDFIDSFIDAIDAFCEANEMDIEEVKRDIANGKARYGGGAEPLVIVEAI